MWHDQKRIRRCDFPFGCLQQLANTVVQETTLSMVSFVLKRAHKNIQYCLDKTVWETSDIYTPAVMDDFVQLYKEALSKVT